MSAVSRRTSRHNAAQPAEALNDASIRGSTTSQFRLAGRPSSLVNRSVASSTPPPLRKRGSGYGAYSAQSHCDSGSSAKPDSNFELRLAAVSIPYPSAPMTTNPELQNEPRTPSPRLLSHRSPARFQGQHTASRIAAQAAVKGTSKLVDS